MERLSGSWELPQKFHSLRANQRFLVAELLSRGVTVRILDLQNELVEATLGSHRELLFDIDSSIMPFAASTIASSKTITKRLLAEAGVHTPAGLVTQTSSIDHALAHTVGFPLVVKPATGSQGTHVYPDIESVDELTHALHRIELDRGPCEVLLEQQFFGNEYRVLMTAQGAYAAVLREPAWVVGDGEHSLEELIAAESYRRLNPRTSCLGAIVVDDGVSTFLRRRGLTLQSVPSAGEVIQLRRASNLSLGGFARDVTDLVDPTVLEICARALASIPALPYAGIDLMCQDISVPQTTESYCILELNSLPGIGMHHAPGAGTPRNAAGMLVDLIFPETIGSAVPECNQMRAA